MSKKQKPRKWVYVGIPDKITLSHREKSYCIKDGRCIYMQKINDEKSYCPFPKCPFGCGLDIKIPGQV